MRTQHASVALGAVAPVDVVLADPGAVALLAGRADPLVFAYLVALACRADGLALAVGTHARAATVAAVAPASPVFAGVLEAGP